MFVCDMFYISNIKGQWIIFWDRSVWIDVAFEYLFSSVHFSIILNIFLSQLWIYELEYINKMYLICQ